MNTIWIVMPILIVLMFLLGIDLNREAFANVAKQPKAVLLGLAGQIILLPLIAFAILLLQTRRQILCRQMFHMCMWYA